MEAARPICWGCRNGVPIDCSMYASPQKFLLALGRGAYTGALVKDGQLLDWDLHKERIKRSVKLLAENAPPAYKSLVHWSRCHDIPLQLVIDDALDKKLQGDLLVKACQSEHYPSFMMVVTALERASDEPPRGRKQCRPKLDVWVYCMPTNQYNSAAVAEVVLNGKPRSVPEAKFSQWVEDRQSLEKLKDAGFHEIMLTTDDGHILEGLTSNIFVVRGGGETAELHTAAVSDGVLNGTMRRRVLAAAKTLGIRIVEASPIVVEKDSWSEAFLTNSISGIRPIKRLHCPQGREFCQQPWDVVFQPALGPVILSLMEEVPSHHTKVVANGTI